MLTKPLPHKEARERIAGLPRVSREVMDGMLPELKAYAFTITGLDVGDQMARVQDTIAAVPAGDKTWAESKKEIAAELAESLGGKQAERRAELLLRTHVFRGYAATRYRLLMEQVDVFPYWQYKTHGDGNVRPSHMALNGKIFPAGHEIWQRIFPPWDWGCRCLVVPLTAGAVKRMQATGLEPQANEDDTLLKTQIVRPEVFTPRDADLIDKNQRLPGGVSLNPSQTWAGAPWSVPGNIRHDWKLIRARYKDQPEVLAAFEEWAEKTEIEPGKTVSMWVAGVDQPTKPKRPRAKKAAKPKSSTSVQEALAIVGIDPTRDITEDQARALFEELKEDAPVDGNTKIAAIVGAVKRKSSVLSENGIRQAVEEFVQLLPPTVAQALPSLHIQVASLPKAYGSYAKGGVLRLSRGLLKDTNTLRTTLFHELTHWVHRELPGSHPWVQEIKQHFEARTQGEGIVSLPLYRVPGKRDKWFNIYMGRIYSFGEEQTHLGLEFPTAILELLPDPGKFVEKWNSSPEAKADIMLGLKGLYPTP